MMRFYADKFVGINGYLKQMQMSYLNPAPINAPGPAPSPLDDSNLAILRERIEKAKALAAAIHLGGTVSVFQRLLTAIGDPTDQRRFMVSNYADDIAYLLGEACIRLQEELSGEHCVLIDRDAVDLLIDEEPLFGPTVASQFPSVAYELGEAAKCLAFERSTASAFHLIRSLESAIRALARCLNIPDPIKAADRNWGTVLRKIKDEIDKRWPTSTDRLSGDGRFFEELYAALAAMQNPYRNATMHLDQKYTPEEARHFMTIINGLLNKIATRMDENGLPSA